MSFLRGYARKLGVTEYRGTWDAATNTPALTSSVGQRGAYYIVSQAGSTDLDGITDWDVGDWAIFNGTVWQRIDNADDSRNLDVLETLKFRSLVTPLFVRDVSQGNFEIAPSTEFTIVVNGNATSGIDLCTQDATTFQLGSRYHIYNNSTATLTVKNCTGVELFQLYSGSSTFLTLIDNTTASGSWVFNVSTSGNFTGASPVTCSYSGGATNNRYLEFFPSNSSDSSPFVVVTDSLLIGLSVSANSTATCEIGVFLRPDLTNPIAIIPLNGTTTNYITNLSYPIPTGSELSVRLVSGSANKPGVALYLTSI